MGNYIDSLVDWMQGYKLDQVYLKMDEHLDEIVIRCSEIIRNAKKEIYVMIDNPLPEFVKHKGNFLISELKSKIPDVQVKLLARRHDLDYEELKQFFPDPQVIHYFPKEQLNGKSDSLRYDYFLIGDKNIFWGKPGFNEGIFTYNAPVLVEEVEKELNNLLVFSYQ